MSRDTTDGAGFGSDSPDHRDPSADQFRGWISPDDRLWRHPSESALGQTPLPVEGTGPARSRPNPWIAGGAAACFAGALIVSGLAMATTGASPNERSASFTTTSSSLMAMNTPPTTEPGTAKLANVNDMARMLADVRQSLVALIVTRSSGVTITTGIIAESGGIIATTAAAIAGARSISMNEPDGTQEFAQFVGSDPISGVAVVRVATDLPVAHFDNHDPVPGTMAMAMALHTAVGGNAAFQTSVYAGAVLSSGTAVGTVLTASRFAVTTVDIPLSAADSGCALINALGQVSGILDTTQTQDDTTVGVFLPAELVLGVARQLLASGTIEHGWLGVKASDLIGMTGARIDAVDPGGAAARAGLLAGDVIVAVNGEAVHSMAELGTRMYTDLPGKTVLVAIDRSGSLGNTPVILTARSADALGGDSPS